MVLIYPKDSAVKIQSAQLLRGDMIIKGAKSVSHISSNDETGEDF